MEPLCAGCGEHFRPNPRVKRQRYCSRIECQNARRRHWQKQKLEQDKDYRQNKADTQRRWRERNPGYWREYRREHPEYVRRNRKLQRGRNQGRVQPCEAPGKAEEVIAKMYELNPSEIVTSGLYRLIPLNPPEIAKMYELTIRLAVVSDSPSGPGVDCKDSTR